MQTIPPSSTLLFHCPACQGRIQTPAQFAGVTAPCPFCAQAVTAPAIPPATWAPAPAPQRAAIRRLPLPEEFDLPESEDAQLPLSLRAEPRDFKANSRYQATDNADSSSLSSLLSRMLEAEEQLETRPRLRRKGKAPFERPLRRTDDRALRVSQ